MNKLICMISLLSLLFLSTQCQSEKKSLGYLRLNFTEGDLPSLLPLDVQGHIRGRTVGKLLYEGLVTKALDNQIVFAGAENVQVSEDGKEYLFTLRKHQWSDGSFVVAQDFETTWKNLLAPGSECSHLLYIIKNAKLVKEGKRPLNDLGVEALDEKTLRITLEYPSPYFLETINHPLFSPAKRDKDGQLCFNGPFCVQEWQMGRFLHLKPNPHFWNAQNVHLDGVHISFIHDFATSFLMYKKSEIDWVGNPFCRLTLEDMEHLKKKGDLILETTNRPLWIYFNVEKSPFTSKNIRQAFSHAVDRDFLATHILLEDNPLKTPLPIRLTSCPPTLAFDQGEAKKCFEKGLEELGMTLGEFPTLELSFQDSHKNLCIMLKQIWEQAFNIKVELRSSEWNVLKTNLEKGNFCMASCTESALFPDPIELLERFETYNTSNLCRWVHSDYQDCIAQARETADPNSRKDLLKYAEELLMREMPFIPVSNRNHSFAYPKNLKNVLVDPSGYVDFRWAYWAQ